MSLFATSDIHLSFSVNKSMTVFAGWENYIERLRLNWNGVVGENDTVVIAGDISWGMTLDEALEDFRFLDGLNGNKLIVKGNHDYWWTTVTNMNGFFERNSISTISFLHNNAYQFGNVSIAGTRGWFVDSSDGEKIMKREVMRLEASLTAAERLGGEVVAFLHYPPVYAQSHCEEIVNVLKKHEVKRCFYGHIHGSSASYALNGTYDSVFFRHIACDCNDFCPVLIEKI